jgi:eukaryotic-like serine/threonine-protein kinase
MIDTVEKTLPNIGVETTSQRYRAFLSYSHRDSVWGNWIHSELEAYRVPKELVGAVTARGKVPAKLRPIFRDRFDLAASHSLGETIDAALAGSESLIVLCSPSSAKSPYVNQEIRYFKSLGRTDQIFALIVDGEPHDPVRECFPDALKYKVDRNGRTTSEADLEPVAADAREHADGKDLAKLKLIAGLLGIGLDELRKREAIAERRRRRVWMLLAGCMAGLAIVAFAGFWMAVLRTRDAERRFEIAFTAAEVLVKRVDSLQDRFGVPEPVLEAIMNDAIAQLDRLTQERGAASDRFRFRQAEAQLLAADLANRRGDAAEQRNRLDKALTLLTPLGAADPDNRQGWRQEMANALTRRATMLLEHNERPEALAVFANAIKITEDLASSPTATPALQNDLATNYALFAAQTNEPGHERERLALLQKGLEIRRKLAADFPRKLEYQRGYAVSLVELGEARATLPNASGEDLVAASESQANAIEILNALHEADLGNADMQHILGTAHSKHGETLVRQARVDDALIEFQADLALTRPLSDANPQNIDMQLDTAVSDSRVANIFEAKDQYIPALDLYRDALRREKAAAAVDPTSERFQERVVKRHTQIAELLKKTGDPAGAITSFHETVVFYEDLAHRMPQREDYTMNQILQHALFAHFLESLGKSDDCLAELRTARDLTNTNSDKFSDKRRPTGMIAKLNSEIASRTAGKKTP